MNIGQTGNATNTAFVGQDGSNGQIIVEQYGSLGVTNVLNGNQYSNNSYASVTQYGLIGANTSTITQNAGAGFDKAYVTQDAESSYTNSSTITQQDGSYASVNQQSNYGANSSTINQAGAGIQPTFASANPSMGQRSCWPLVRRDGGLTGASGHSQSCKIGTRGTSAGGMA